MGHREYILLSFSSLFVIIDPIAAIPAFLAMTSSNSTEERQKMARLACSVACIVLVVFSLIGKWVFKLLGISMPAFQMAGSLVLLIISLDMLRGRRSAVQETKEETAAGAVKEDIAITPLAVPMLAGPGALSTAILLEGQAASFTYSMILMGCIVFVCYLSYVILRLATHGAAFLSPIALKIVTRIMGLLLAAVAVQFMVNAFIQLRSM